MSAALGLPVIRRPDGGALRWPLQPNSIAMLAALIGLLSLQWPFVVFHLNRVMPDGDAYPLFALSAMGAWLTAGAWLLLGGSALLRPGRLRALALATALAIAAGVSLAALSWGAVSLAADNEFARVSVAAGAWTALAALYVGGFALYSEAPQCLALPVCALAAVAYGAPFQHLGIVLEYREVVDVFQQEFTRHILLVAATMPFTLLIGASIGLLAARKPAYESLLLGATGFLQTIPSIALFGLLLPLLSSYGRNLTLAHALLWAGALLLFSMAGHLLIKRQSHPLLSIAYGVGLAIGAVLLLPALGVLLYQLMAGGAGVWAQLHWSAPLATLGVRGLGAAPAIVALVLYGMWPMAVNTHTGLKSVPAAMLEAAKGMGMHPRQIFWRVELPIAAPFFIQGLRGAVLLLIGLATVAVLVNAGGLGFFLLRGTEQSVPDLVLLGSLPVVLLALAADAVTRLLGWALEPRGGRA